jgi:hypothetical protein
VADAAGSLPAVSSARSLSKRLAIALATAVCAALAALALTAAAPASAATCPSFRVLHDDRIGQASFPGGNYEVKVMAGLSCEESSKLFARFLADWDGTLPKPWQVVAEGSGKASFSQGDRPGFSVERVEEASDGGNTLLGKLCPGSFTVNAGSRVGPLLFPKGQYLLYIPARSGISCRRASVLFTRFLAAPGGTLPFPWRLKNQTATFYKPAHPERSAFRIEPISGA